jgi:hypothetical protein
MWFMNGLSIASGVAVGAVSNSFTIQALNAD